jgi:hypothetical protein
MLSWFHSAVLLVSNSKDATLSLGKQQGGPAGPDGANPEVYATFRRRALSYQPEGVPRMNDTKKQSNKQEQQNQWQMSQQKQGLKKQDQNPGKPREDRKHHEQELPETRMTR